MAKADKVSDQNNSTQNSSPLKQIENSVQFLADQKKKKTWKEILFAVVMLLQIWCWWW